MIWLCLSVVIRVWEPRSKLENRNDGTKVFDSEVLTCFEDISISKNFTGQGTPYGIYLLKNKLRT